jgi:uncharacterized damage-inducible protein DinB
MTMSLRRYSMSVLLVASVPVAAFAQAPVADAFRHEAGQAAKNLVAAAELMPAAKYGYKPTPAQMSVADIVMHLAEGNDYFCGAISGTKAPTRSKITAAAHKDSLVARLRETFKFCDQSLASLDDSKLSEELPMFGGQKMTRAAVELLTTGDWADHYSQMANYLRLNGILPPTAKKP